VPKIITVGENLRKTISTVFLKHGVVVIVKLVAVAVALVVAVVFVKLDRYDDSSLLYCSLNDIITWQL